MATLRLVFVEKDGDLRTHVGRLGVVTWDDGSKHGIERKQVLPACGAKVDVAALYDYDGTPGEVTCGRCQQTGLYKNASV